ncbi:MAG: hypothetical protein U0441_29340 [Polyangiaceae bacterium]
MRRARLIAAAFALVAPALATGVLASSCGARSELPYDSAEPEEDAGPDVVEDAPPDIVDAPPDIVDAPPDVPEDALPICDPDVLYIYLVTSETDLYRYRPDTGVFSLVGSLSCPSGGSPFSMGVSRTGIAYVVYNDGSLFKVDTKDASCDFTDWVPGTGGFNTFGMGYAIDDDKMGETLHVAEINFQDVSKGLATIDTTTFDLGYIGPFSVNPGNALEMTSSDDGFLYGYFLKADGTGGVIVQIDKHTADIVDQIEVSAGSSSSALAFAYWGGDFYIFTSDGSQVTTVTKYAPSTGTESVVATLNRTVVGAGVSTCTIP